MGGVASGLVRQAGAWKRRGVLAGVMAALGAGQRGSGRPSGRGRRTPVATRRSSTPAPTTPPRGRPSFDVPRRTRAHGEQRQPLQHRREYLRRGPWAHREHDRRVRGRPRRRGCVSGQVYGVAGVIASGTVNASGVKGTALQGVTNGVWGENTSTASQATGVYGLASGASGGTVGIWGRSQSSAAGAIGASRRDHRRGRDPGPASRACPSRVLASTVAPVTASGPIGTSGSNIGVYGASSANVGVFGDAANNTAVMGRTGAGIGVYGTATNPAAAAGRRSSTERCWSTGRSRWSAARSRPAVKHPDGSVRRMYCQEAPEPWFEDFGTAHARAGAGRDRAGPGLRRRGQGR